MTRVVVLGDVMVDGVAHLRAPLAHASDSPASIAFHGGGSAANTAAWLAFAGESPVLVARVGDDTRGREQQAELAAAGVETHLSIDPGRPTGTCLVIVGPDGERTMIPDAGANDGLASAGVPSDLLARGGHLHVAGYALLPPGSRPAARAAILQAQEAQMTVSVDPSSAALLSPAFLDHAGGVDLLLPNATEARALSGLADPGAAAGRLCERFGEVVVTLGAQGALWTDGAGRERAAAEPVETIVDTTGAGDAFAAGFLAARLSGAEPREALAAGCRLGAEAVATPGARPPGGRRPPA